MSLNEKEFLLKVKKNLENPDVLSACYDISCEDCFWALGKDDPCNKPDYLRKEGRLKIFLKKYPFLILEEDNK